MSHDFGFERVYVESEWYDGPRSGIADIHGAPHRFLSNFDEADDEYLSTYMVFPIDAETLALEQEQWSMFVHWNRLYESGKADVKSHPAHGGIDGRWDEIETLLAHRRAIPPSARQAKAEFQRLESSERYTEAGPDYRLRWTFA